MVGFKAEETVYVLNAMVDSNAILPAIFLKFGEEKSKVNLEGMVLEIENNRLISEEEYIKMSRERIGNTYVNIGK